jgi:prephenate dehydrogenase
MSQNNHDFIVVTVFDAQGGSMHTVVNESCDNVCIHGYDAQGKYQQFDSYELYHTNEWAKKHGFVIISTPMVARITVDTDAKRVTEVYVDNA